MKVVAVLFALISLALAGPVQQTRVYFPEENDPEHKRFIYIEKENGDYELIDLMAPDTEPQPRVAITDVEYDLYTKSTLNSPQTIKNGNVQQLASTPFDKTKTTVFVVHGWNNNRNSGINREIREAIFKNHDVNLFICDWSGLANKIYLTSKNSVVDIGKIIGNFVNGIQDTYGIDGSNIILIGHSLGAHIMGSAGATIQKKVDLIIGLDPAGPLFSLNRPDERLDVTDANFVQVIHTNGNLLGFRSSIGDIDFFPNGGMGQPGCGLDLAGTCAHGRSHAYLAEALERGPVFVSVLCENYNQYERGLCANNAKAMMGELHPQTRTSGDFFLETNPDKPYAKGS